jgi:hypothetical protein
MVESIANSFIKVSTKFWFSEYTTKYVKNEWGTYFCLNTECLDFGLYKKNQMAFLRIFPHQEFRIQNEFSKIDMNM